ncbi:MAG TPA: GAP family protein [Solirubrobacteraceae bacterium]|nr:GAP family protein [Solirubrobacteraceae bacterium]
MPTILALGFAAAIYPQLLAVVVVILTRPNPQRLLWGCCVGAAATTLACSAVVLVAFRGRESIAQSNSRGLGAETYLIAGTIALLLAILVATRPGRELLGRARPRVRLRAAKPEDGSQSKRTPQARTEKLLERGSVWVALGVGAILGIPGPFDLLALGHLARSAYGPIVAITAIVAFTLIKFLLIEVPILSYAIDPGATAARVARFAAWMKVRKIELIAGVVGVIGVVLIGRGISGLT